MKMNLILAAGIFCVAIGGLMALAGSAFIIFGG